MPGMISKGIHGSYSEYFLLVGIPLHEAVGWIESLLEKLLCIFWEEISSGILEEIFGNFLLKSMYQFRKETLEKFLKEF